MKQDDQLKSSALQAGRRLVLFGPEGFREAPRDQRLVIIMGTDPSKYFAAVNKVLSKTTTNSTTQPDPNLSAKILAGLVDSEGQTAMIGQLLKDLDQSTK